MSSPNCRLDEFTDRVLVTGAAGFVGFHVAQLLVATGSQVLGFDNVNDYYDVALKEARLALLSRHDQFRFIRADFAESGVFAAAVAEFKPSAILHLGAQAGVRYSLTHPQAYIDANMTGFLNVLEACRHHPVRHLVYASSSSVYGDNSKVPFAEDNPVERPSSLYAVTKRSNELMARTYAKLFGLSVTGLRFFTVYGPWGRPDMAYFSFTKALLEGQPIEVFNHGNMERDFTYIDDVVDATVRLLSKPVAEGEVRHRLFNIGNHNPITLNRFIAAIEAATGKTAKRILRDMQPGDVPRTYADVSRLIAAADFSPDTTIEDGIARFVAWYRNYYRIGA